MVASPNQKMNANVKPPSLFTLLLTLIALISLRRVMVWDLINLGFDLMTWEKQSYLENIITDVQGKIQPQSSSRIASHHKLFLSVRALGP